MRIVFMFVLLTICSGRTTAAADSASFAGTVTDSEGAVITNATIIVHWDSAGSTVGLTTNVGIQNDLTVHTDTLGRFSLDLPSGFYDVFVSAISFSPQCTKVRILRPIQFNPKLSVDPLVSRELAHPISAH